MNFSKIPLFNALAQKMDWLSQRQEVLARNIANVNTPGYRTKDLASPDFGALMRGAGSAGVRPLRGMNIALRVTDPRHIGAGPTEDPVSAREIDATESNVPIGPSGNTVLIERELMKVAKNAVDFDVTTSIYRRYIAMFRTALGRSV